ncbi:MAG: AAA family ATPase [Planctomycetes bacterium]|nr:AAA family ATPase [Planctomycetota bacterium]
MLTKLVIRNFKRFEEVELELGKAVVFIGPNNSGKTTALQALALWDIGLKKWNERRKGKSAPEKRPGVTINRKDLIAVPVPGANLLWRDLHVRASAMAGSKPRTKNVCIEIIVDGVSNGKDWKCGLEFDYANEESFYCRPLRLSQGPNPERMPIPEECSGIQIGFLPPMSGLAANEDLLKTGAINVRLGEGRTAEVLRNLCYQVHTGEGGSEKWASLCEEISKLFGVKLDKPQYLAARGEIKMTYRDTPGVQLDLSSAGRGLQQTLLLLSFLSLNPGSILLLDEPDAHLEILRQRQIYQLLTDFAEKRESQVIAASHSEVILNEAADRDVVIAFVGKKPHRIDDRGSQLLKALKDIGYEDYYQVEETGWVLYLEGSTDLAILRAFAESLGHSASQFLERPFVKCVENKPHRAREHFYGLREAKEDLLGFALFDHLDLELEESPELRTYMWNRREIENYLSSPSTLLAYAKSTSGEKAPGPLFEESFQNAWVKAMQECLDDLVPKAALRDPKDPFWMTTKASDQFLDRLFKEFFKKLQLPNLMQKTDYHVLARHMPKEELDPEVTLVLDAIVETAKRAKPVR